MIKKLIIAVGDMSDRKVLGIFVILALFSTVSFGAKDFRMAAGSNFEGNFHAVRIIAGQGEGDLEANIKDAVKETCKGYGGAMNVTVRPDSVDPRSGGFRGSYLITMDCTNRD